MSIAIKRVRGRSRQTAHHELKESMGAGSQAEVIEKAVAMLLAIQRVARS